MPNKRFSNPSNNGRAIILYQLIMIARTRGCASKRLWAVYEFAAGCSAGGVSAAGACTSGLYSIPSGPFGAGGFFGVVPTKDKTKLATSRMSDGDN
jgi:hypothetical protein